MELNFTIDDSAIKNFARNNFYDIRDCTSDVLGVNWIYLTEESRKLFLEAVANELLLIAKEGNVE